MAKQPSKQLDLTAGSTTQVEVLPETGTDDRFKLYVHEGGITTIRLSKLKAEQIKFRMRPEDGSIAAIADAVVETIGNLPRPEENYPVALLVMPGDLRRIVLETVFSRLVP